MPVTIGLVYFKLSAGILCREHVFLKSHPTITTMQYPALTLMGVVPLRRPLQLLSRGFFFPETQLRLTLSTECCWCTLQWVIYLLRHTNCPQSCGGPFASTRSTAGSCCVGFFAGFSAVNSVHDEPHVSHTRHFSWERRPCSDFTPMSDAAALTVTKPRMGYHEKNEPPRRGQELNTGKNERRLWANAQDYLEY